MDLEFHTAAVEDENNDEDSVLDEVLGNQGKFGNLSITKLVLTFTNDGQR